MNFSRLDRRICYKMMRSPLQGTFKVETRVAHMPLIYLFLNSVCVLKAATTRAAWRLVFRSPNFGHIEVLNTFFGQELCVRSTMYDTCTTHRTKTQSSESTSRHFLDPVMSSNEPCFWRDRCFSVKYRRVFGQRRVYISLETATNHPS